MSALVVWLAQLGARLHSWHVPILPKVISVVSRIVFSCQVSPGAQLGRGTRLSYGGLGVVIHGNCQVGDRVTIGTHVTIGGNFPKIGVPQIGNDVFIGTGAKILGPLVVGNGAVVGANSVVLSDVPARAVVVGAPARIIRVLDGGAAPFGDRQA